ncbi:DUF3293 domain-containing protein [Streptomyces populi]|uniref:DUF3293 domain-containing protein n=1 Tax=Streptomyces populi TaxID=2058924 RepID=UPI0035DB3B80
MHAIGTPDTPQNWELYRHAVVDIHFPDRTVRVGPRSPGTVEGTFPEPADGAALHVITAWNPRGRTSSAEYNAHAHGLLLDELDRRRLAWWPAAGGDTSGTHTEESVAVVGMSEDAARELGRRFGQDAIFTWTPDTWRLSACDGDTAAVSGWAASARPGRSSSPSPSERFRTDGFPAEVTYETHPLCGARRHVRDRTSPLRRSARPAVEGTD